MTCNFCLECLDLHISLLSQFLYSAHEGISSLSSRTSINIRKTKKKKLAGIQAKAVGERGVRPDALHGT